MAELSDFGAPHTDSLRAGERRHPYPPDSQTALAAELYGYSRQFMPEAIIRAGLTIKTACADCNCRLGYLSEEQARIISQRIAELRALESAELHYYFPLDPFQGGAGTSFNMNLNEAVALGTGLDPLLHVNLHQSTNDVLPTALRLALQQGFSDLEERLVELQNTCQIMEERYAGDLITGRTQLRDAQVMSAGKIFAGWAQSISRDRWRCFKSRERIKEINLGGTAIGSGAGAPRDYVLQVSLVLQEHVDFPVSRADDMIDATASYDGVAEAMGSEAILAQNIQKICGDIRLLASGPGSGFGELVLPVPLKGSSIMAGKVNPVIAEAGIQLAQRVMANESLLNQLCGRSELQLNAFWPGITQASLESLELLINYLPSLSRYIGQLQIDTERTLQNLARTSAESLNLLPLLGYNVLEQLMAGAAGLGQTLRQYLSASGIFSPEELAELFSPALLTAMGQDPENIQAFRRRYGTALNNYIDNSGVPGPVSPASPASPANDAGLQGPADSSNQSAASDVTCASGSSDTAATGASPSEKKRSNS